MVLASNLQFFFLVNCVAFGKHELLCHTLETFGMFVLELGMFVLKFPFSMTAFVLVSITFPLTIFREQKCTMQKRVTL